MNETEAKNHDSSCYHSFSNIEYPIYSITICICFSLMNSSNKQQLRENWCKYFEMYEIYPLLLVKNDL